MPPQTRSQTQRLRQQQQQQQQQPQVQRYDQVDAFKYEFDPMRNSDYEGAVSGIWMLILNHYFPSTKGYIHRPEQKVGKGFVDIDTHQWVDYPADSSGAVRRGRKSCKFLMTQCKRQAYEYRGSVWQEAEAQLQRYMSRRLPWGHPIYGIVAVGRRVRFYKWNPRLKRLVKIRPRWDPLHIVNDADKIHNQLLDIQQNHTA